MTFTLRAALLGGLALGIGGVTGAYAQQPRSMDAAPGSATGSATGMTPRTATTPAERRDTPDRSNVVDAGQLESGSNSFTEGQARARLEDAGFTGLQELRKDDAGFWRGRAMHNGASTEVALDFRGRIAAGAGVANLGAGNTATGATAPATGAAGGARPDGTPGNPPGTAAGRAVDRATGTDTTGATGSRPDGTPGNPPSTAVGRAVDRAQGETPRPDGTPGNPPGTAAGRAVDRATGSNTTGANPAAPAPAGGGMTR